MTPPPTVVPPAEMDVPMLELYIEMLTEAKNAIRRSRLPAAEVEQELSEAWDHLRRARAAQSHGTTEEIASRARVERELLKLMNAEQVDST